MFQRSLFPRDMFSVLERLQREMQQNFDFTPSIRGITRGGFPALNIGSTLRSVEIHAFVPGVDPDAIDVHLEKGVLTIAGERREPVAAAGSTTHIDERFTGAFRRVVSLPDDIDAGAVTASYKDGVLHISIARREGVRQRRIVIE
ncbi:Hsp20/alpha crystallin family protein [Paludibacterium paludis]|uniref:Heat-shock protein Hsp20 n=1 Tax=Paludibacterium paludis TaxID=1225769 RepID=A0A918P4L7_9NEIS|nr:Hsp20/alpha crystallin family protein [Paludibacterium paludis]GGY20002.1 heat-shock protein Hsp20 [Paludibacterium paludis]